MKTIPQFDYSIEYSHIYTNSRISEEQEISTRILGDVVGQLTKDNKSYVLTVLIDDYSFPDPTFNYVEFEEWLARNGYKIDVVVRESQLIPICDEVLSKINDQKLKLGLIEYIKTRKKYPCSLFIAAWYLLRLGEIKSSIFNENLVADKLINILPISFKPFEDKGFEIISKSSFSDAGKRITNQYHEGRLIA